ncbi:MAG TPA: nickel pincer cofactor biosynthesis protein LarC [Longimicrobiales bacterium]
MRALIFDPFAGISGDMILGALVDLGLEPGWLEDFVASVGIPDVRVRVERTIRRGISCGRVHFELPHEHAHRHLRQVLEVVDRSAAPQSVKETAGAVFHRLAAAEAAIHGTGIDEVHFHEVGALDAILDVLCAIAGLEELGFEECYTRPVAIGRGFVDIAHGRFPLPAPATLRLLEGLPVHDAGWAGECTTPTGAAILATVTQGRRAPSDVVITRSGYGAGSRDPEDRPNCLRLIACELPAAERERLYVVQADVDDLPPEYVPPAQEALFSAGALDATVFPLSMKRGRPGVRIEALAGEAELDAVLTALFRSTSTIGARYWAVGRRVLSRETEVVEWRGQRVRRKRVRLPDGVERTKPEYEDVLAAARALGLPAYQVWLELDDPPVVRPRAELAE